MSSARGLWWRRDGAAEANVQADVGTLLLYGGLNLDEDDPEVVLEAQVGGGRRIDIEAGLTVIETKRDLAAGQHPRGGREAARWLRADVNIG